MKASAIVLAAGSGTRMKSSTPKVAHEMLGKPLVRWVIDAAREAGVEQVVTVLGHGIDIVRPLVEPDCTVVRQQHQNGTADAVESCRDACRELQGSLLVLSGDCPLITSETIAQLVRAREQADAAVAVLTMEPGDPFGYGRIVRDEAGQVTGIVEQKDCTPEQAAIAECNSGFYCFDARYLFDALSRVSNENAQGEYYLTDVIGIARAEGLGVAGVKASSAEECLGVNTRVQLAQATRIMQQRINTAHMLAGVTMWDPSTVWIGPDVRIEQDVELLPMTMLTGPTSVGQGSAIGPDVRLDGTSVGRGCVLERVSAQGATFESGTVLHGAK